LAPFGEGAVAVDWDSAAVAQLTLDDLFVEPDTPGAFADLPSAAAKAKSYTGWGKDFTNWMFRTRKLEVLAAPELDAISQPGESERDFRARLDLAAREERDAQSEALRKKYAPKIAALEERLRKAQQKVEKEAAESTQSKIGAVLSVGASVLGAFLGRKAISATNVGKVASAVKSAGKVMKESKDVAQAGETVEALQEQLTALNGEFEQETAAIAARLDPLEAGLETIIVRPTKTNIANKLTALVWVPHWEADGERTACWE